MQIFHLSLSLSISRLHTHTPSFLQTGLGAILQGLQRESQRKASSFLPSLPRISKPFVYLEPPFPLSRNRPFLLPVATNLPSGRRRKRKHRKQGGEAGSSIEVEVFSILLVIRPSFIVIHGENICRESRLASFQFLSFVRR